MSRQTKATCCPPINFAAAVPDCTKRCIHRVAELALTSKRSAASCRDAPTSIDATTWFRKSKE
jgi:hypothetical protein